MLLKNLAMSLFLAMLATTVSAQVQFGFFGSHLNATGANDARLWGGGVHMKFFLGQNIAIGGSMRTYPKKSESIMIEGITFNQSDLLSNLTGTFDLLLSKRSNPIQPYIGADAGFSFSNQILAAATESAQSIRNENKQTFFLVSPKAGINIGLGQTFGIFGQAQYNMTFGNGDSRDINLGSLTWKSTPVDKYFSYDAGIYVRLVGAGKKG